MSVVTLIAEDLARQNGKLEWVTASLPSRLRLGDDSGDVHVIDGTAGWSGRASAAVAAGAAGIVVVQPQTGSARELQRALSQRRIPVVLDQRWASHESVSDAHEQLGGIGRVCFSSVTARVTAGDDVEDVLRQCVEVAAQVLGDVNGLRVLHRRPGSVVVGAVSAGGTLTVILSVGPAQDRPFRLHVVATEGELHLDLPDGDTALPGILTVGRADATTISPLRWEGNHRMSWRRLIAALDDRAEVDDLRRFDAAAEQLAHLDHSS